MEHTRIPSCVDKMVAMNQKNCPKCGVYMKHRDTHFYCGRCQEKYELGDEYKKHTHCQECSTSLKSTTSRKQGICGTCKRKNSDVGRVGATEMYSDENENITLYAFRYALLHSPSKAPEVTRYLSRKWDDLGKHARKEVFDTVRRSSGRGELHRAYAQVWLEFLENHEVKRPRHGPQYS